MHFSSTTAFKLGSHLLLAHSSFRVLYLSLLMNQSDLKDSCEKYFGFETNSCIVMFTDTARGFIAGLASFQGKSVCFVVYVMIHECQHLFLPVYRETRDSIWLDRASKEQSRIKFWSEQGCPLNFLHKSQLMEAEDYYSKGDFQRAKESYRLAISSAKNHRFVNEEGEMSLLHE